MHFCAFFFGALPYFMMYRTEDKIRQQLVDVCSLRAACCVLRCVVLLCNGTTGYRYLRLAD